MEFTDAERNQLATQLGFPSGLLQRLRQLPLAQASQVLRSAQDDLPARYKKLAFELHPDRNPQDPGATRKFQLLAEVRDQLARLKLARRPPRQVVRVVYRPDPWASTTSSTTASVSGWGTWVRFTG